MADDSTLNSAKPDAHSYLRRCREDFASVTKQRYGREFDLNAIEEEARKLRAGKRHLSYEDLRYFQSEEHWQFRHFWVFPPEDHLNVELGVRTFDFHNLPKREVETIRELYRVFLSIEHVSILLRFIRPKDYGILSPPVERVLEIRRGGSAPATYQQYLSDLREIRDHRAYGLDSAADVDMALWVLHERCFGRLRDGEIESQFLADPFMARLRGRNLVAPLVDLSLPRLAQALAPTMPNLAALIAFHRLEIQIRTAAKRFGNRHAFSKGDEGEVPRLVSALKPIWGVAAQRGDFWVSFTGIRNDLVHADVLPDRNRIDHLVEEVVRLERDLDGI